MAGRSGKPITFFPAGEREGTEMKAKNLEATISPQKFRLYIVNRTPRSLLALANLKRIREKYLGCEADVEVVDLQQKPHLAKEHQIVGIPTLVRIFPKSSKRVVGDLSDTAGFLRAFGLVSQG
jgi:circadian clock protein KaiB